MRKIILNLALSLDGYIADLEGGFDWIQGHPSDIDTKKTFDFKEFMDDIDTIVMGSLAYEDCVLSGLDTYEDYDLIVATSRPFEEQEKTEFYKGDICQKILSLKDKPGKDIWLFGGGGLIEPFVRDNIIDEYIIGIVPIILGSGRPLFKGSDTAIPLKLIETTSQEGILINRYVKR